MESKVYGSIKSALSEIGCLVKNINGAGDHVHVLFHLHPSVSLSEAVRRAKSKSAFIHNQSEDRLCDLSWQNGYSAFSVSPRQLKKVEDYISNQKIHHGVSLSHKELDDLESF